MSLSIAFVVIVGFPLILSGLLIIGVTVPDTRNSGKINASDYGPLTARWMRVFKHDKWMRAVRREVAYLEHELDLYPHRVREDCLYCTRRPKVSEASNITPLIIQAPEKTPEQIAAETLEKWKQDKRDREYLAKKESQRQKDLAYAMASPRMTVIEGDVVEMRNMNGQICVTYTEPERVHCMDCSVTELHSHELIPLEEPVQ
jgi:hypothetical protein